MVESTAVIIPAYNAERFLSLALDSALAQSRPVHRILVVDDASSDGTVALARGYASRGHPVEVLTGAPNGGPGSARNRGLDHTDAEVVFFLDADDRWRPGHSARLLDALERHDRAGFVHAFGAGRLANVPRTLALANVDERVHEGVWPLLYHSDVPQSAVAARRALVRAVGGYGEGQRHAEDYDLWLRLAFVAPYVEVREETFERGIHDDQATRNAPAMSWGAWKARHRLRGFAEERGEPLDEERWGEVLRWAYERDLDWAWQSRSRAALDAMLAIHPLVPGGEAIYRAWHRRARRVWPVWRAAAWLWDVLPPRLRREVRRRIGSAEKALDVGRRSALLERPGNPAARPSRDAGQADRREA